MSSRHQTASRPAKSDRRLEHHRERQATRAALYVSDLEEVLDPPSVHNVDASDSERPKVRADSRRRHWKQPFWKRRTRSRHDKNEHHDDAADSYPSGLSE